MCVFLFRLAIRKIELQTQCIWEWKNLINLNYVWDFFFNWIVKLKSSIILTFSAYPIDFLLTFPPLFTIDVSISWNDLGIDVSITLFQQNVVSSQVYSRVFAAIGISFKHFSFRFKYSTETLFTATSKKNCGINFSVIHDLLIHHLTD